MATTELDADGYADAGCQEEDEQEVEVVGCPLFRGLGGRLEAICLFFLASCSRG